MLTFFKNTSQIDVATVLMLIGEATIWKAAWSRMRGTRRHWTHYIFAVSPGWTPLAGTLFTAMNGGARPFNLIYDRIPEGCGDKGLQLTNLLSGATHAADQTILQNIWESWTNGMEARATARRPEHEFDITKQVGFMDVNLDQLTVSKPLAVALQLACLAAQIIAAAVFFVLRKNGEVLILFLMTLTCQLLLIYAITPRSVMWDKALRGHRGPAVMLHKGSNTSKALIIPRAYLNGANVSLEEFCWSSKVVPSFLDRVKTAMAGISFLALVLSMLMIGWMENTGKVLYLIIGMVGLISYILDATMQPNWTKCLDQAFYGIEACAPINSSLMGCVGILIAGQFSAANDTATRLYPDNARFRDTIQSLENAFSSLCPNCRKVIREGFSARFAHPCTQEDKKHLGAVIDNVCTVDLTRRAEACDKTQKQLSDALASVARLLSASQRSDPVTIHTAMKTDPNVRHSWW